MWTCTVCRSIGSIEIIEKDAVCDGNIRLPGVVKCKIPLSLSVLALWSGDTCPRTAYETDDSLSGEFIWRLSVSWTQHTSTWLSSNCIEGFLQCCGGSWTSSDSFFIRVDHMNTSEMSMENGIQVTSRWINMTIDVQKEECCKAIRIHYSTLWMPC